MLKVCNLVRIKELIEKVKLVSTTDELTGLHNRKYLQDRLEAEMSRAKRHESKVSCLLFDIDYFKVVNDMYGYEWGDVLLKKISEMLKSFIRKEDILTRYGDEEFVIILPDTNEDMLTYSQNVSAEKLKKWNSFLQVKKKDTKLQFRAEFLHILFCKMLKKLQIL